MTDVSKKPSLEERLSLAAKKSKKKTKKSSSPVDNVPIVPEEDLKGTKNPNKVHSDEKDHEKKKEEEDVKNPTTNLDQSNSSVVVSSSDDNPISQQETSGSDGLEETIEWKSQIDILNSLKDKEPWSQLLSNGAQYSNVVDFITAIEPALRFINEELQHYKKEKDSASRDTTDKEKDELIAQLRYEGENLAATELRQNNTIKSLRKKLAEMDNDIKVTQEELYKKIGAYEQLFNSHENLQAQLQKYEGSIQDLSQDNIQLKESASQLKEEKKELENIHNALKNANLTFTQREKTLIAEVETLKASSQEQITQLEASLEKLRIELESGSKKGLDETDDNSKKAREALKRELESLKSSSSHLENSLTSKVSDLENQLHKLEQSNKQLSVQLQSFKELNRNLEERLLDERKEKEVNAQKLRELELGNEKLQTSLQDSIEDYKLLQNKYEIRHSQMGSTANEFKHGQLLEVPDPNKDGTVTPTIEEDWMYPPNVSQISPMGTPMDFENSSLQKEADEISDRPPIEDDKVSINDMDIPDEAAAMGSPIQEMHSSSKNTNSMNYRRRSTQVDFTGQMNAHMISKLGAEVRRYEAELVSLQNNCERLQMEKTEASNEILRLLEDNEKVQSLSEEKDQLLSRLDEAQHKLEASLQVLGEKTEKVEELENDVADLKEMMQQQIQQMADMQERLK